LSRAYNGMDRFRIASMARILDSGRLDPDLSAKTIRELTKKMPHICRRGTQKREK